MLCFEYFGNWACVPRHWQRTAHIIRKRVFQRKLLCPISEFCALFALTQNNALPLPDAVLSVTPKIYIDTKYSKQIRGRLRKASFGQRCNCLYFWGIWLAELGCTRILSFAPDLKLAVYSTWDLHLRMTGICVELSRSLLFLGFFLFSVKRQHVS